LQTRSRRPVRKVVAGSSAAAIATRLAFVAARQWHVEVPPDVVAAAAGLLVTVAGAVTAYITPPSRADMPVPAPRRRPMKDHGHPIP
jgi:hypothetical protein